MARPPADLMSRLEKLKADFQHFADRYPWICLSVPPKSQPGCCRAGEAGTGHEGLAEVVQPKDHARRAIVDHVEELTFQAEQVLSALIQFDSTLPAELFQELRDERPILGNLWVRWLRYAVPMQHIFRYRHYAQVAATVLASLQKYFVRVDQTTDQGFERIAIPGKVKGKNIDARMLKVMFDNPESHGWSARQWADHLGCSDGTIKDTPTWKERLKAARSMRAADAACKMERSGTRPAGRRKAKHTSQV